MLVRCDIHSNSQRLILPKASKNYCRHPWDDHNYEEKQVSSFRVSTVHVQSENFPNTLMKVHAEKCNRKHDT